MAVDLNNLSKLLTPIKVTQDPTATGSTSFLPAIVFFIITILLYIAGIVLLGAILYGGFLYISSAGDEAKATKGRNSILYGIIGAVIVMLSFVIIKIIQQVVSSL